MAFRGSRGPRFVPHVRQSLAWDCGFACTEMVLRALGVPAAECSLPSLRKHVPVSSIWTVDLAYVMRAYGVHFRYCTMTMGVDPTYKNQPFYRETLDDDSIRVNKLFEKAEQNQIAIEHRSVSRSELIALLRPPQENMVMALVDRRYLYKRGWFDRYFSPALGFIGHYVLLVGYDASRDGFYLYDPARTAEPEFASATDQHRARVAHGTDEDLLIVPWGGQHNLARLLRRTGVPESLCTRVASDGSSSGSSGGTSPRDHAPSDDERH